MPGGLSLPASPVSMAPMSASDPIMARPPVAVTNSTAAATLGPIDPAAKLCAASHSGVAATIWRADGIPQSASTAATSVAMTKASAANSRASTAEARS